MLDVRLIFDSSLSTFKFCNANDITFGKLLTVLQCVCTLSYQKLRQKTKALLPSQAFFLLGSILNLPGLKFYLLYCEQEKTRPHDRAASELGKQGIFFPSTLGKQGIFFPSTLENKIFIF